MISLEQVQLLEEKVAKAIEYVRRVNSENTRLVSENKRLVSENIALADEKLSLISKMEANQKRIDELEVHVLRFKEEQSRIEDGIIAALDRLSQFEEAFENSLKDTVKQQVKKTSSAPSSKPTKEKPPAEDAPPSADSQHEKPAGEEESGIFFEIPKEDGQSADEAPDESSLDAELDIF